MQAPIATYSYSKHKLLIFYAIVVLVHSTIAYVDTSDLVSVIIWGAIVAFIAGIQCLIVAYGIRYELYEETFDCFIFGVRFQLLRNRMCFIHGPSMGWFTLEEKITRGMPMRRIHCYNWLLETPIDTKTLIKEPVISEATQPAPNS